MSRVLVLNAGYEPLHQVSVQHAVRMLVRQVASVDEAVPGRMLGPFPWPRVVRLHRYVAMGWRYRPSPGWSRSALLARDGWRCAYCGDVSRPLTVDHVLPKSQGGLTTWENTVAACGGSDGCNELKADRTPAQAGMVLRCVPYVPSWAEVVSAPRR